MKSEEISEQLKALIDFHLDHYDNLAVQDIYKLLHQGVNGPKHLLADVEEAHRYLLKEWRGVEGNTATPLIDPISLDRKIIRINLRPYKAQGGDVNALWRVFYSSARDIEPNIDRFGRLWERFCTCCKEGLLPFSVEEAERVREEMAPRGYPPKHHSPAYREANKPCYRVVLTGEFKKIESLLPEREDG
jgi:hypothetical protein